MSLLVEAAQGKERGERSGIREDKGAGSVCILGFSYIGQIGSKRLEFLRSPPLLIDL